MYLLFLSLSPSSLPLSQPNMLSGRGSYLGYIRITCGTVCKKSASLTGWSGMKSDLIGWLLVGWLVYLLRWFCCALRKVPNRKSCWWTECCTESRDCPKGLSVHCTQLIMIINIKRLEPVLMGGELPSKGSWCLGEGQMLDSEEGSRPDHEHFSPNA